jgi:hypothetical protein
MNFLLRNIDSTTFETLKNISNQKKRSINNQLLIILELYIRESNIKPNENLSKTNEK